MCFIYYFYSSDLECVTKAIRSGIDINCTSAFFSQHSLNYMDGATALIIAANDHANDVAHYLIDSGVDVFCTNSNGDTALHRY